MSLVCYPGIQTGLWGGGAGRLICRWVQVKMQSGRVMGLWQGGTDPMSAGLCEDPSWVVTGVWVSSVSLVRANFLGDRQRCGMGEQACL